MCKDPDCARSRCALSVDVLVSVLDVQCYASGEVRFSVVISVVISICLIELSVPVVKFYFSTLSSWFSLLWYDTASNHPTLVPKLFFSHVFHCILTAFSGVVFTHPVGYNRPTVNNPTVTKQVNSRKSCLEEVSHSLAYQVALINQCWVRLHGDSRRHKESTMILASSTKTKNNFVSIVGFVELLVLSIAAR